MPWTRPSIIFQVSAALCWKPTRSVDPRQGFLSPIREPASRLTSLPAFSSRSPPSEVVRGLDCPRRAVSLKPLAERSGRRTRRAVVQFFSSPCHCPVHSHLLSYTGSNARIGGRLPLNRSTSTVVSCPVQPCANDDVPLSRVSTFGLPWTQSGASSSGSIGSYQAPV